MPNIPLTDEDRAFYRKMYELHHDPEARKNMTRDLMQDLDRQITAVNEAGYPTADLTFAYDALHDDLVMRGIIDAEEGNG